MENVVLTWCKQHRLICKMAIKWLFILFFRLHPENEGQLDQKRSGSFGSCFPEVSPGFMHMHLHLISY